jgi:hypothetical protein
MTMMTISNKIPRMEKSVVINFPTRINPKELARHFIRQLSEIEDVEDYNSFRRSLETSARAKKLFLVLLKDRISRYEFFGKYFTYLESPTDENKDVLFLHITSADEYIISDLFDEIEEVFQFRPEYYSHHLPCQTDWIKKCIQEYFNLKQDPILKIHYEEIILENLFKGVLNGLSDKISNLFDDELGRI